MAFWVTLLIFVVGTVLTELLRPKPKFDSPDPSGLSDFSFPTIGEGRAVPLVWGTCKLPGPMVTWYGDLQVQPITEKVRTSLFNTETITTGYRYNLGIQMALCSGTLDAVPALYLDDVLVPITTTTTTTEYYDLEFDEPTFFGVDSSEGGLSGTVRVYRGTETQVADDYLETAIGEDLPAYRGVIHAVFRGVYVGNSAYIKPAAFVVKRVPNPLGLTGGAHDISGDANPANMIWEMLTAAPSMNGLGLPPGLLDLTAFRAVGQTLATEGMGLSMVQDRATAAQELILEIMRHVDGILYVEPTTGLLTVRLVRFDYDVEDLPVLDESNCTVKAFNRAGWSQTRNTVRVQYVDRAANFTERVAQAQDLASVEVQGGEVSVAALNFRGFSTAVNGQRAAARGLAALSPPLASLRIEADRTAWAFRPGTAFVLNWPPLGIAGMVVRVARISGGRLEDGKINFDGLEDVFGITWTAYAPPPVSAWEDPVGEVEAPTDQAGFAAPWPAVEMLSPGPESVSRAVLMFNRGAGITQGWNAIVERVDHSFAPPLPKSAFTPAGTLAADINWTAGTIQVNEGVDSDLVVEVGDGDFEAGLNVLWMDGDGSGQYEEFIAFRTVSRAGGVITLGGCVRGCIDTIPSYHTTGKRVWFLSYGNATVNINAANPLVSRNTIVKFQPFNKLGVYAGTAPSEYILALKLDRATLPYNPTAIKLNGLSYPSGISGQLTVSWSHRNRLAAWTYGNAGMTSSPEDSATVDIKVYGEAATLIHEELGVTGTSWTYLEAEEIADSGALGRLNNALEIHVRAAASSLRFAHQIFIWSVTRP